MYLWHSDCHIDTVAMAIFGLNTCFERPATDEQNVGGFLKGDLPVRIFRWLGEHVRYRHALLLKLTLSSKRMFWRNGRKVVEESMQRKEEFIERCGTVIFRSDVRKECISLAPQH